MIKLIEISRKLIQNNTFQYIISKYLIYIIQFLNSIFIAYALGPFFLGIWGIIQLIIQYFAQFNLGIAYSSNVIISLSKNNKEEVQETFGNAVSLILIYCLLIVSIFALIDIMKIGYQYDLQKYIWTICAIICLNYINNLFINLFRIYNKINEIIYSQSVLPIISMFLIIFFEKEMLIAALIFANLVSVLLGILLFYYRIPINLKLNFNYTKSKLLLNKGLWLFIYNASFYLLMISIRSFVGKYYTVTEFGYFTFAFSLANAMLLLIDSLGFLIYPKLLVSFSNYEISPSTDLKFRIFRSVYMTLVHFIVYTLLMFSSGIFDIFNKYVNSINSFRLLLITMAFGSSAFGYSVLLISSKKEKGLAIISLISLILNCILAFILIRFIKVDYENVIIVLMFIYFIYSWAVMEYSGIYREKSLYIKLKNIFPVSLLIPCLISFVLIVTKSNMFYVPFIVFLFLNIENIKLLFKYSRRMVNDNAFMTIS